MIRGITGCVIVGVPIVRLTFEMFGNGIDCITKKGIRVSLNMSPYCCYSDLFRLVAL